MKKHILISLLAVLAVAVCVSCDLVEDAPSATTAETEAPTEIVTDLGHDDPTEPPTETLTEPAPTETKVIPSDTLEPVVFEDEALNAEMESLRAEGYDMEQLTFRDVKIGENASCIIFLNNRYFTNGDVLRVTVDDVTVDGEPIDMRYKTLVTLTQGDTAVIVWRSSETSDRCPSSLFIPDGFAPGVYFLQLEYGGQTAAICPVIVYEDNTLLPQAPAVYEDEVLNETVSSLRNEGYDMEKLVWRETEDRRSSYYAILNQRAFKPGETVELSLPVLMTYGNSYYDYAPEDYIHWIDLFGIANTTFTLRDTTVYTYTIPEGTSPGEYWICINLVGEDCVTIGPIVVY